MAQKTVVTLVDDLTGEVAENISTVEFGIDGVQYEIDLTDKNADKLRSILAKYTDAGRRTGGRRRPARRVRGASRAAATRSYDRETLRSIREWAKKQGHPVSDRGRLPSEVLTAWEAAQKGKA